MMEWLKRTFGLASQKEIVNLEVATATVSQKILNNQEELSLSVEAMWDRIREVEGEQSRHDPSWECKGCRKLVEGEVQHHMDDLSITDLISRHDIKALIKELLIEELSG